MSKLRLVWIGFPWVGGGGGAEHYNSRTKRVVLGLVGLPTRPPKTTDQRTRRAGVALGQHFVGADQLLVARGRADARIEDAHEPDDQSDDGFCVQRRIRGLGVRRIRSAGEARLAGRVWRKKNMANRHTTINHR